MKQRHIITRVLQDHDEVEVDVLAAELGQGTLAEIRGRDKTSIKGTNIINRQGIISFRVRGIRLTRGRTQ